MVPSNQTSETATTSRISEIDAEIASLNARKISNDNAPFLNGPSPLISAIGYSVVEFDGSRIDDKISSLEMEREALISDNTNRR
jgi:hypothetical protein